MTIDNDVAGTDTKIGFDTAVNTALLARAKLLIEGAEEKIVGIKDGRIVSADLEYAWKGKKKLDLRLYQLARILSA